jgi:predicted Zn-dependent protease
MAASSNPVRVAAAGAWGWSFFPNDHSPEHFAKEAARQAIVQLEAREAPAGEMEVVLGPGWPGILLHEAIGHGLEADFNRKGISAFSGRWASAWPPTFARWWMTAPFRGGAVR